MLRWFLVCMLVSVKAYGADFSPAKPMPSIQLGNDQLVTRVAFGSCFNQRFDDSIFDTVTATRADAFLYIGDNVYAEDESNDPNLQSLRNAYGELAASESFQRLRESIPMLVTWDDHDYGLNDAGGTWSHREASEALFEHVWAVDEVDERSQRPGVYYEKTVGPEGRRVQLIVLDTRFFRSKLERSTTPVPHGRYQQHMGDTEMLGAAQWQWLEEVLQKPADVRIIASSVQVVATGHAWEAWHLMPEQRQKLYRLFSDVKPNGVVLVSGDRHSASIYRQVDEVPYPIYEVTASSLNVPLSSIVKNIVTEPGEYREGLPYYDANFGVIDIDWVSEKLLLQVRDEQDRVVRAATINLSDLRAKEDV